MVLTVNGVDMIPYIFRQGVKWQRSDIDAANSGRTMDGVMHRGRVCTKVRLDVTCRPLTLSEASIVLRTVLPEYVTVTYTDPMEGTEVTKVMYSNNNPASFCVRQKDGTEYWDGISFPLIEQ